MKSKLLIILLLTVFNLYAQVPNTATFTLQDVANAVGYNNLSDCFTYSNADYFDPAYGSITMNPKTLYGFRNYGPKLVVNPLTATNIRSYKFTVNCEVTNCTGYTITECGICWNTTPAPTLANNHKASTTAICGSYSVTPKASEGDNILAGVQYYVRPYVILSGGTVVYSANAISFSTTICPSVGESRWGGIIAYVYQSGDAGFLTDECHGIISYTSDISTGVVWSLTKTNTGATSYALNAGITNTNAIVANQGTGTYAARLCYDFTGNGYSDWVLPSMDALRKLWVNRSVIGGFYGGTGDNYWSSTETSSSTVAVKNFLDSGDESTTGDKYVSWFRVRPIRYF